MKKYRILSDGETAKSGMEVNNGSGWKPWRKSHHMEPDRVVDSNNDGIQFRTLSEETLVTLTVSGGPHVQAKFRHFAGSNFPQPTATGEGWAEYERIDETPSISEAVSAMGQMNQNNVYFTTIKIH